MKALILAGGKGVRLRPLTYTIPKQLVPVANRPILHYVVDQVALLGIKDIGVIISKETGDLIVDSLKGNPWNLKFTFIRQEEPLGLAHAIVVAEDYLKDSPFVMYLGDNLIQRGLKQYMKIFKEKKPDVLILAKKVKNPQMFGVLIFGENGMLMDLVEKPKEFISPYAMVGIYFFTPKIIQMAKELKPSLRGEYEITDAIKLLLINGGKIIVEHLKGWWLDTGKKDDILEANKKVLQKGKMEVIEDDVKIVNSKLVPPYSIGRGATIVNSVIGPNVSIGRNSYVEGVKVRDSVILEEVKIKNADLGDCLLGSRSVVLGLGKRKPLIKAFLGDDTKMEIR